jgi:hypothetical protein
MIAPQVDEVIASTGVEINTVTADAGYAHAKVFGALERRHRYDLIPAKAEPIRSRVPLRRFVMTPSTLSYGSIKRVLRPTRPVKHGRFFYSAEFRELVTA